MQVGCDKEIILVMSRQEQKDGQIYVPEITHNKAGAQDGQEMYDLRYWYTSIKATYFRSINTAALKNGVGIASWECHIEQTLHFSSIFFL